MAYSSAQRRLYLGYDTGAIRQIDVTAASPVESAFATLAAAVTSLASAGNFVIAQTGTYSYDGGFILNGSGVVTDQGGYYYGYSREIAWDPVNSRVYFTRDGLSPNDLHYDVLDQTTGHRHLDGRVAVPWLLQHPGSDPRFDRRPIRAARQRRHLCPERTDLVGLVGLAGG